jgi:spore coat polysaccharide biosynthesis protein SpsF
MNIVAAIQVRMGSSRLPGKGLADIVGRPMLWHIVNRVRAAKTLNEVVIATTDNPADEPIRAFARAQKIPYFAGSELDVADRLYSTAKHFKADAIVRITGDCPLADPDVIEKVVAAFVKDSEGWDYITNTLPPTFPDGLDTELFPAATLKRLFEEVRDPFWREWFNCYIEKHLELFRILNVTNEKNLSKLRWTVDYAEDLAFVRAIYERLYRDFETFGMSDVLSLLKADPELAAVNANYVRNEGFEIALKDSEQRRAAKVS